MTIIDLDTRRQHVVVPMRCTDCFHEFLSVHLASTRGKYFECPKCHEIAAKEQAAE